MSTPFENVSAAEWDLLVLVNKFENYFLVVGGGGLSKLAELLSEEIIAH